VVLLAAMVVVGVLHEEVLVQAVARKGDRRDPEPRERALEPVEPCEAACVAPGFAVIGVVVLVRGV
jgi:hypothetical protein